MSEIAQDVNERLHELFNDVDVRDRRIEKLEQALQDVVDLLAEDHLYVKWPYEHREVVAKLERAISE